MTAVRPRTSSVQELMRRLHDDGVVGGFVLGAPGTYVARAPDRVVIGHRPGGWHRLVALTLALTGVAAGSAFYQAVPLLGAGIALFFAVPALLVLGNTQRYEIEARVVRARGRALGRRQRSDVALGDDVAVDLATRIDRDADASTMWTVHVARLRAGGRWVPLAESLDEARVRRFAADIAAVVGATPP